MKLTLICPTNYHGASATKGIYYPMGVLTVGSLVKDAFPDFDVAVLDGEVTPQPELEERIKNTDILGLSANTCNYPSCLLLAKYAKQNGVSKVVLGGPHASAVLPNKTHMAELILKNQQTIDAVIVNDGEEPFLKYLTGQIKGTSSVDVDNLFYKDSRGIHKPDKIVLPTKPPRFTDMNFSLMNFETYWKEHAKEFPEMSPKYVEGFTHVGCTWRAKAGCVFCDIPYPFNNYQAPGKFWRDLREAKNVLGIESFKDYGDCLTGNPERVGALLRARPADMTNMEFSCYGRSSEISEQMADMLAELNVKNIYIGFDSGDNRMLKNMGSGYSVQSSINAVKRLAKRGINITGSLILGAAGESKETIANTEAFAKKLLAYPQVTQLHCAMLTPFPGAPMYKKFLEANPGQSTNDVCDTEFAKRLWVKRYCVASYEYIEQKAREINNFNPSSRKRFFGLKSSFSK